MAQHRIIQSLGYYCLHTSKISCKLAISQGSAILTGETLPTTTENATKTSKRTELVHLIGFSQVG